MACGCGQIKKLQFIRYVMTSSICRANYYETLKLPPTATHAEIKLAYFELTKMYHPDKRRGDQGTVADFRKITAAYEVLGNVKLRKMYDKGLLHDDSDTEWRTPEEKEEDDATTLFYKQREKRMEVPKSEGETNYNFDLWTKDHCSYTFKRKQAFKENVIHGMRGKPDEDSLIYHKIRNYFALLAILVMFLGWQGGFTSSSQYIENGNKKQI